MEKSVTEGIFPGMAGLFSPVGTEQVQRLQEAGQPVDPLQAVSGSMGFLGERMRQGIGSAFGQMPQQDRKRQVFQQLVQQLSQQGVDISTSDGMVQLAQKLSSLPGFEGEALNLRQKAAQMAQQAKTTALETQFKQSQIAKNVADAQKSGLPETIKTPANFAAVGQELGIPAKPNIANYTQSEAEAINARIQDGSPTWIGWAGCTAGYDMNWNSGNPVGEDEVRWGAITESGHNVIIDDIEIRTTWDTWKPSL